MKFSKKCKVCAIWESNRPRHDEILSQTRFLGSRSKGFSWFQENYPTTTITSNNWHNHFSRHVEEKDYPDFKVVPKEQYVDPNDLKVVVYENDKVAINPEVQVGMLHMLLLKRLSYVAENLEKIENGDQLFLNYLKEGRMQADALDKYRIKNPSTAKGSTYSTSQVSEDKTLMAAIEIDPSKGKLYRKKEDED